MKNKIISIIFLLLAVCGVGFLIPKLGSVTVILVLGITVAVWIAAVVFKKPLYGLLLLIYALPFERIPTYDLGLMTIKINQVVAGILILSYLGHVFSKKNENDYPYPSGWIIALLVLTGLISAAFSIDTQRAISVLIFTIFMAIVGFVVTKFIKSTEDLKKLITALFAISFFILIFSFYQFLGDIVGLPITLTGLKDIYTKSVLGFPRIHGFSMEPLYFANFLFFPLGIALSYYFYNIKEFKYNIILVILILLGILLGISRGAYIGLAFMALFFFLFKIRKVLTIKNVAYAFLIVLFLGTSAYFFLKASNPQALDKFIEHAQVKDFAEGESVQKRLGDYEKAIIFWQEKPIIGIGPGNYGPRYENYPSHDQVTDWEIVNNQYIEMLTEWGVVGLTLYMLLIFYLVVRTAIAYKKTKDPFKRATLTGMAGAFVAIFIQYNFFSTIYIMHIWVFIGLLIAAQNLALYEKN